MSIDKQVLVVLNNFSRPQNMESIVGAWKWQTYKDVHIVMTDNTGLINSGKFFGVHDCWQWNINSGCPCHFYPALSYSPVEYPYTIFADDDLLPGRYAIETLLWHAETLENEFATIGQIGRTFILNQPEGKRYSGRNSIARHPTAPMRTHLTCRAHMIRTEFLPCVLSFRNCLALHSLEGNRLSKIHDDFLLCMGIQEQTGFPSYLTTVESNKECALIKDDLDDNKAVWRKSGHFEDRNKMVDLSLELGWKPIE